MDNANEFSGRLLFDITPALYSGGYRKMYHPQRCRAVIISITRKDSFGGFYKIYHPQIIRAFIVEERQHIVWEVIETTHRLLGSLIRPCLSRLNIGRDSRWSCLARHIDDPRGKTRGGVALRATTMIPVGRLGGECRARHPDDPRKEKGISILVLRD